jgi:hypothetical protein
VCFITAAGFLNGPGFQKMREDLRRTCDEIWVIDCSPEGHQPDIPTRIFQGVQQPVCIVLASRSPDKNQNVPARSKFTRLPKGKRDLKFKALAELSLGAEQWQQGSNGWRDSFLPEPEGEWAEFPELEEFFDWASPGVTPHRVWVIAPDSETLQLRWDKLRKQNGLREKERFFQRDRDRFIDKVVKVGLGKYETRPLAVAKDQGEIVDPCRYAFRSFDRQWIIPDHRLLSMARPPLWNSFSDLQVYLTALEASSPKNGPAITFAGFLPDLDHYKGSFGGRVYPLWRDAVATEPNVRPELLKLLAKTHAGVTAEDVFAYIAAVMAHPAFTARFKNDLIQPGLRLPLTADAKLFKDAVALGREVIWLHTYGERFVDKDAGRPKGAPRMMEKAPTIPAGGAIPGAPELLPEEISFNPELNHLVVGRGYVENVSQGIWDYEVSGKRVLWHWFSYRKRDRTRTIIGEKKRPPSPLEKIQPDHWLPEYTTDLLDLLNVLGRLIALEPKQADLLARICDGPLIHSEDIHDLLAQSAPVDKPAKPKKKSKG